MGGELETLHKLQEVDERLYKRRREIEAMEKRLAERRAAMAACEARTQELIQRRGNDYLKREFPRLDYVKKATIVEPEGSEKKKIAR